MSRSMLVALAVASSVVSFASLAGAQVPTVTPTPGTIVRLELKPVTKTISVGEFANYTATGFDAQGVSRNMTQKVEYASSDPTVADVICAKRANSSPVIDPTAAVLASGVPDDHIRRLAQAMQAKR